MPSVSNSEGRQSIPQKNIERIKEECHRLDDDMRWLVALLCDSGLRLGEATGLAKDDLVLDHSIPHIKVKPHL
jgi:integrase